jgi:purine-nucleoside phosphorylase
MLPGTVLAEGGVFVLRGAPRKNKALFCKVFLDQDLRLFADKLEKLVTRCVGRIRRRLGSELPRLALVLGSGFDAIRGCLRVEKSVAFRDLPGFPRATVPGHAGELLLAEIGKLWMLVCCGRAHFYEGASMEGVMFPARALGAAGITELLLTNAAGGINSRYKPGDFMVFSDHINFTGVNPLRGFPRVDGRCFVDLTEAYSPDLRRKLRLAARKEKISLHEGVYVGVSGPSYETPAEIRAFRGMGADAVGMSTIPEVLMARYCGMEVAALSCITNYAAGIRRRPLSHGEVLERGRQSAEKAVRLITAFAAEHSTKEPAGREKI